MPNADEELKSRLELLDRLFDAFKQGVVKLGGWDGYSYAGPLCDILIRAVHELRTHEENVEIDKIIDNALNKKP